MKNEIEIEIWYCRSCGHSEYTRQYDCPELRCGSSVPFDKWRDPEEAKVGDLVRWTHLTNSDLGIVIGILPALFPEAAARLNVQWLVEPDHSGHYRANHHSIKLV